MIVEMFCDGACRGNPGPGGWGVLLRCNGNEKELCGAHPYTTNNRMELAAAIEGLNCLNQPCVVHVVTDSQYVHKGITQWIVNWEKRDWRGADGKVIKNVELWQFLVEAVRRHNRVTWQWVRGHSGHVENERADALANAAIDELLSKGS